MASLIKNIFFFTCNRSEYYILEPLIDKFHNSKKYNVKIMVSSSHLKLRYGNTIKDINSKYNKLIIKNNYKDSLRNFNSLSLKVNKLIKRHRPSLIVILGDRNEAMVAAMTAFILKIPIAHIHGGEKTKGSYDDIHRHVITKFSNIHFCVEKMYKKRLLQLGEDKKMIFNFGYLSKDNIQKIKRINKDEYLNTINLKYNKFVLLLIHPTGENKKTNQGNINKIQKFCNYLSKLKFSIVITAPADEKYSEIIFNFIYKNQNKKNFGFVPNLGAKLFYNSMYHADFIIGNSSSIFTESHFFGTPSINLGSRQNGRVKKNNIYNCKYDIDDLKNKMQQCLKDNKKIKRKWPKSKTEASKKIFKKIEYLLKKNNIFDSVKTFHDI